MGKNSFFTTRRRLIGALVATAVGVGGLLVAPLSAQAAASASDSAVATTSASAASSTPIDVYRFFSPTSSTHFYTASTSERDSIIASYPASTWTYEGVAYDAFRTQATGTVPLYRFVSPRLGEHFYTSSSAEKNSILANYPASTWTYEGIAFYAYPASSTVANTVAVSRFWSPQNQQHFYTASVTEKNAVIANYPANIWTFEGDTFRVPAATSSSAPVVPPTTPPVTTPPTSTAPPAVTTGFPTRTSAGLPAGWTPKTTVTGDYYVRTAGAVVSDMRITNGSIIIQAPNVTLNNIEGIGAFVINGQSTTCYPNLLVENSTFIPNGATADKDDPVIQYGSYTAKNIVIDGQPEGLRVSDGGANCGPVSVIDSFIRVKSPTVCGDWHGDGIQGYGGDKVTVRNTTILMQVTGDCYGTAPFFYPKNQGNTSVDIDGLLVGGSSGYPFRNGMPGTVKNLDVIQGSWVFGPIDVNCSVMSIFQAQTVTLNAAGQPVSTGSSIGCTGQGN